MDRVQRRTSVETLDRRRFVVQVAGASATFTVAGAALARVLTRRDRESEPIAATPDRTPLPNSADPVQPVRGTRPELTSVADHYRIDIDTRPPRLDAAEWRLRVEGLCDRPTSFRIDELRAMPSIDRYVTLSCISNPVGGELIGTTRWTGVPLRSVLERVGASPEARYARIFAADGFHETLDLEEARNDERVMLAHAWDGAPLTVDHGFPLRIWIPGRYGMKQPKWIERIELVAEPVPGYWVARGWDATARVKATSVIDTVAVDDAFERDGQHVVPIGGIAYAGDRGISRVELQIDDGPWEPARLRSPLSDTTWVLWRHEWPMSPGAHRITVRCFDGNGAPQITMPAPPHPSGASGLHQRRAVV